MPIPAMVRNRAKPQVNFRHRMNTGMREGLRPNPPRLMKTPVVTKTCPGLNRAFSLFVNALATNAA
jgi:hypothetical protein